MNAKQREKDLRWHHREAVRRFTKTVREQAERIQYLESIAPKERVTNSFTSIAEILAMPEAMREPVAERLGASLGHGWFKVLYNTLASRDAHHEMDATSTTTDPWVIRILLTASQVYPRINPNGRFVRAIITDAEEYLAHVFQGGRRCTETVLQVRNALNSWRLLKLLPIGEDAVAYPVGGEAVA